MTPEELSGLNVRELLQIEDSHDITTADGRLIQVKAMGQRAAGNAAKFSGFRTIGFDSAIFLVFDTSWELVEAWELEPSALTSVRRSAHTNSSQPTLTQVRSAGGSDVTAEMRAAWHSIVTARASYP